LSLNNVANADDFRLLYSTDSSPVGLNVISYKPEDNEDGYFALLATPDTRADHARSSPRPCFSSATAPAAWPGRKSRR
jgi:Ca-activated chloride channel homolog